MFNDARLSVLLYYIPEQRRISALILRQRCMMEGQNKMEQKEMEKKKNCTRIFQRPNMLEC